MTIRIFVYGSLMSDVSWSGSRLMSELGAEFEAYATVKGKLWDCGPYPAVTLDGENPVHGEIWRLPDAAALASLDDYEDAPDLYRRVTAVAIVDGWRARDVELYIWNKSLDGLRRIRSGSWREYLRQQEAAGV